jgi:hypothetical protein
MAVYVLDFLVLKGRLCEESLQAISLIIVWLLHLLGSQLVCFVRHLRQLVLFVGILYGG